MLKRDMRSLLFVVVVLVSGCSGSHPAGPSEVMAPTVAVVTPEPTAPASPPIAPPPRFDAKPVCVSSRLPASSTETRSYTVVGPARDGVRSNPFEMSYGPKKAYGVWSVEVTWQREDAPLAVRVLKQDAARSVNPVLPVNATTARTGATSWSACWEGEVDDRMTVEIGFPSGSAQDVSVTWTYPSPKTAP